MPNSSSDSKPPKDFKVPRRRVVEGAWKVESLFMFRTMFVEFVYNSLLDKMSRILAGLFFSTGSIQLGLHEHVWLS
jgi:hypothetical protein